MAEKKSNRFTRNYENHHKINKEYFFDDIVYSYFITQNPHKIKFEFMSMLKPKWWKLKAI